MSFRHDDAHEEHQLAYLAGEARALTSRLPPSLDAELSPGLDGVAARLDRAAVSAARRRLRLIDRAEITRPCAMRWEDLPGDLRRRHCARCDRDVWDLSELTADEGEALLARSPGLGVPRPCVLLTRRADGTVLTKGCGASRWPAIAAAATLPVLAAGAGFLMLPRLGESQIQQAEPDALAVRSGVELLQSLDPSRPCPSIEDLTEERVLSSSTRVEDPWGDRFRINCGVDGVEVRSDGPDHLGGTEDDVVVR